MTTVDFARRYLELRGKQREYYRVRNLSTRQSEASELLADCKRLEANLDRVAKGILDAEAVIVPSETP